MYATSMAMGSWLPWSSEKCSLGTFTFVFTAFSKPKWLVSRTRGIMRVLGSGVVNQRPGVVNDDFGILVERNTNPPGIGPAREYRRK